MPPESSAPSGTSAYSRHLTASVSSRSSSFTASSSDPSNGQASPSRAASSSDQYGSVAGNGARASVTCSRCPAGILIARAKMHFGAGTYKYCRYDATAARSIVLSNDGPASIALSSDPNDTRPGSWYTYSGFLPSRSRMSVSRRSAVSQTAIANMPTNRRTASRMPQRSNAASITSVSDCPRNTQPFGSSSFRSAPKL